MPMVSIKSPLESILPSGFNKRLWQIAIFLSVSITLTSSKIKSEVTTVSLFRNNRYSPFAIFAPILFGLAKPWLESSFITITEGKFFMTYSMEPSVELLSTKIISKLS